MTLKGDASMKISPEKLLSMSERIRTSCKIDPELYAKYEVKRGLRDISGEGVLVGLTDISEIHSHLLDSGDYIPCEGKLYYRGIDVEEIVEGFTDDEHFGFEEVTYLLLFGDLPTRQELDEFKSILSECRRLPDDFVRDIIMKAPSRDMMNTLARSVLALYTYDPNPDDISLSNVLRQSLELIAQFPLLAVYGYQAFSYYHGNNSLYIHPPLPELSTAENILRLLRPDGKYTEYEAKVLDLALVLHAEHGGGNNSTFATHVITSTGTDTYSTIASSLCSLKGPRHGGANVKVAQMFDDMKQNIKDWEDEGQVRDYLNKLLDGETFDRSGLIYGVGHAVYSISDPRAEIFKEYARALAKEKGFEAEFSLYEKVERLAPEVIAEKRKIYKGVSINVDFYSGFVYKALNIPEELFTPLFAVSRIVGWSAHRIEELVNRGKIIRPAYRSIAPPREYVPLSMRNVEVNSLAGNL